MPPADTAAPARFAPGHRVRVRTAFPTTHCRTPFYLRGREGEVLSFAGRFHDPEKLAYHKPGLPERALYRVRFAHAASADEIVADLYEHWLEGGEP
jgi:nitrile hydratase subunit beta